MVLFNRKFLLLVVFLALIFGGIVYFQKDSPADLGQEDLKADAQDKSKKSVEKQPQKVEPVITTEKMQVNVTFLYEDKELYNKIAPLYEIHKEDNNPVKIAVDGDLAKSLIEELELPEKEEVKTSYIKTARNSLDRIIKGEPIIGVDKEKTLIALEETIKENNGASSLNIPVYTKIVDSEGGYEKTMTEAGFKTLIASYSTLHKEHKDDANRNVNLKIASEKIDSVILKPGQNFSFNKVVGNRTKANGFKDAGVIQSGRVIPGIGGGICQVSTTLYRAALLSGLKIVERHNHSIYDGIEYADRGLDSAVAWGYKDLIFRNNNKFPILVTSTYGDGFVEVKIYSEKPLEEKITLETRNEVKVPFRTIKTKNSALKAGTTKILHPGVVGYTIDAYRITDKDGEIKEERVSRDRYLTYHRREESN